MDDQGGGMASGRPLVIVIDSDRASRETVCRLVGEAGISVRAYPGCRPFLADAAAHDCDCLVLDVRLPDGDGLALQKQLSDQGTRPPVVFVSAHGDVPVVVQAMRQGALDFLEKPVGAKALLARIREAIAVAAQRRRDDLARSGLETRLAALTPREREVMQQMLRGKSNKAIGQALGISVRTVEHHRGQVMRKMEAGSLPALIDGLRLLRGEESR